MEPNEFEIPSDALEKMKDPAHIKKQVEEGKTFQEILGYSSETMDKFYDAAHHLFQKQQYEEAADAFVFLTTLNPKVHSYWLGLGMSEQLIEEHDSALLAYGMAILTNMENPLPHYHSASCYHALQDRNSAIISLELAIRQAEGREEFSLIKEKAEALLNKLNS